jgi:hypothetical protein
VHFVVKRSVIIADILYMLHIELIICSNYNTNFYLPSSHGFGGGGGGVVGGGVGGFGPGGFGGFGPGGFGG